MENDNNELLQLDDDIAESGSMVATFEFLLLIHLIETCKGEELFLKLLNFKLRLEHYCVMMGTSKKHLEDKQMLLKIIKFIERGLK